MVWPSRLGLAGPGRPWAGVLSRAVALPSARITQAESGRGPVVLMRRPSSNRKNVFDFSFIIWEEKYFGKYLCTHFGSKFVETNFVVFLVTRST